MDLVGRAKNILMAPKSEWRVIAGESADAASLYRDYMMWLAAIPPLASLIGIVVFIGHIGFGAALAGAIAQYVLNLVGIYIAALIAAWLAPRFGGREDRVAGLKLVGYAHTAGWVGGIFLLLPVLGVISLLCSLYGLYLLYLGVVPVMEVPESRATTYTIALIVAVIVLFVVLGLLLSSLAGLGVTRMM